MDKYKPLNKELRERLEAKSEEAFSGGGGVTSWNDIPDKPFGEEIKNYLWYGNRADMESFESMTMLGGTWIKVSDFTDVDALENGIYVRVRESGTLHEPTHVTRAQFEVYSNTSWLGDDVIVVREDPNHSPGLWVGVGDTSWVEEVYTVGYETLDPQYLPKQLQFGEVDNSVFIGSARIASGNSGIARLENQAGSWWNDRRTFTVVIDGVKYTDVPCVTQSISMGPPNFVIGNPSLDTKATNPGADNGLPFALISSMMGGSFKFIYTETTAEVDVELYLGGMEIKPIDPKYLPENVGGGLEIVKLYAMDSRLYYDEDCNNPVEESFAELFYLKLTTNKYVVYDLDHDWEAYQIVNVSSEGDVYTGTNTTFTLYESGPS